MLQGLQAKITKGQIDTPGGNPARLLAALPGELVPGRVTAVAAAGWTAIEWTLVIARASGLRLASGVSKRTTTLCASSERLVVVA